MDPNDRNHRSMLLFGAEGQAELSRTKVVVGGASGLGSPLAQHLALLQVAQIASIDPEELDHTNRNRHVAARDTDPIPGSLKVHLVERMVQEINRKVDFVPLPVDLLSEAAFNAVKRADWVCGCFDHDGPRSVLNELAAAYSKPYIDLASDVPEPGVYGGHVMVSMRGDGCLHCMGLLDQQAVRRFLMSSREREEHDRIYGIDRDALDKKGPSVSPLNGVIASLGALEFMVAVTGLREPKRLQTYRGDLATLRQSKDQPAAGCPICKGVWGRGAAADVERYLRLRRN